MAKRLVVLVGMLAVMLAMAMPVAFAQQQASATGVLRAGLPADVGADGTHSIEDEASGTLYALRGAGADLDAYNNQRVTVYGVLTPGEEGSGEGGFGGSGTLPSIDVTRVEPLGPGGPPPGPPSERSATLSFELAVECDPPAGATFFGNVRTGEGGPGIFVQLLDPDGDGLYTGVATLPDRFAPGPAPEGTEPVSLPVSVVQGAGTRSTGSATFPGEPISIVKDFGAVPMEAENAFSASASFCDDGGSDDDGNGSDSGGNGTVDGDTGVGGSSSSGSGSTSANGSATAAGGGGLGTKILPATGGSTLLALGAGALLVGGGLLVRRITR